MNKEVVVTVAHLREAKVCINGSKTFFDRHSLDWKDFLRNGISSSILEEIGDALALKVVEVARGRK